MLLPIRHDIGLYCMSVLCVIGVWAQSTLGEDIFAWKYMYEKLTKCSKITWYLHEKVFFPNIIALCAPTRLLRLCFAYVKRLTDLCNAAGSRNARRRRRGCDRKSGGRRRSLKTTCKDADDDDYRRRRDEFSAVWAAPSWRRTVHTPARRQRQLSASRSPPGWCWFADRDRRRSSTDTTSLSPRGRLLISKAGNSTRSRRGRGQVLASRLSNQPRPEPSLSHHNARRMPCGRLSLKVLYFKERSQVK